MPAGFTPAEQMKWTGSPDRQSGLGEAASKTKFLPVDHPLIQTARDAGSTFGD